jgi:transcription termination factor Rho
MSPRSEEEVQVVANDSGEAAEAKTPRKRGRPRKNPEAPAATPKADKAAASKRPAPKPEAEVGGKSEDVRPAGEPADESAGEAAPAPARGPGRGAKAERASANGERQRDTQVEDSKDEADGHDSFDEASEGADQAARGRGGRNRRNRPARKPGLNFRELHSKILPELHLLAKEVQLEDYRQMSKDDLVVAILERSSESEGLRLIRGYLEISSDGYGFLQESLLQNNTRSVIVSAGLIKQFRLRTGDLILGKARRPRDNERYGTLIRVEAVNSVDPFQSSKRPRFEELTPTFPEARIQLETIATELSTRVIDLLAPIGRGQRGLIVAPPKAGKTTLLKKIANAVVTNEPDIKVIVLLVDERPEEVTDFRESVHGVEVVASTFDEPPSNHIRVAEFVHERARRIVEDGGHAMILLDSITRLARANNLVTPATGRTLSGGLDSNALHWPKRFLGAARNIRGGGSLSILATALVETGSRMDDVIFEEFKGTGNMELHLSRHLEERRIFPAIDILKSGTRREDLLLGEDVLAKMWLLRKVISDMDPAEAMEMLLGRLGRSKSNAEFLATLTQG